LYFCFAWAMLKSCLNSRFANFTNIADPFAISTDVSVSAAMAAFPTLLGLAALFVSLPGLAVFRSAYLAALKILYMSSV
ncbi:MAG: hypothetical protein IJG69_10575, partial [Spirochaetales bacterium]|nr:hypothetical protein [Spirochaetales bacterium]